MRECKKCDNLVTDEQVKNCHELPCPLQISNGWARREAIADASASHYVQHEGADIDAGAWETLSGSPKPSDQKTGFDFGAVREPLEDEEEYYTILMSQFPEDWIVSVRLWKSTQADKECLKVGLVFKNWYACELYLTYIREAKIDVKLKDLKDMYPHVVNLKQSPGTGDGFSVAPRPEPIPSSMAMKFEVFGDPGQLANLSQRVFEILNEDAGVKIRKFNITCIN